MKKIILYLSAGLLALTAGISIQYYTKYDFATLDGSTYTFNELEGNWIVVNYFAEWCAPCLREIPELNHFQEKALADNTKIKLFGVSYDAMQDHELQLIADKYDIQFPLITDVDTALPFELPKYLPATYLIRPDGSLAGQLLGEQSARSLQEAISAANTN
ncbi:TlpA family protein disulfide reductase [Glaciecola sp. MH2013]|uniref:TlpA family protein disulfide reductase n=1 Tax=Glaciecola sp. MH2013 TaxID=2785524 RepID=UPI00189E83F1|nr:TlpA disulfide reductase family protein [Glaciecola sp. MH2013]MBF7072876.1 TlpA family protein disulfide reductase [Glaciecola sp. MH2013]